MGPPPKECEWESPPPYPDPLDSQSSAPVYASSAFVGCPPQPTKTPKGVQTFGVFPFVLSSPQAANLSSRRLRNLWSVARSVDLFIVSFFCLFCTRAGPFFEFMDNPAVFFFFSLNFLFSRDWSPFRPCAVKTLQMFLVFQSLPSSRPPWHWRLNLSLGSKVRFFYCLGFRFGAASNFFHRPVLPPLFPFMIFLFSKVISHCSFSISTSALCQGDLRQEPLTVPPLPLRGVLGFLLYNLLTF